MKKVKTEIADNRNPLEILLHNKKYMTNYGDDILSDREILITCGVYDKLQTKYGLNIKSLVAPVDIRYGKKFKVSSYKCIAFPEDWFNNASIKIICGKIARKIYDQHRKYGSGDIIYPYVLLYFGRSISEDFTIKVINVYSRIGKVNIP